jgi:hypothetical protein
MTQCSYGRNMYERNLSCKTERHLWTNNCTFELTPIFYRSLYISYSPLVPFQWWGRKGGRRGERRCLSSIISKSLWLHGSWIIVQRSYMSAMVQNAAKMSYTKVTNVSFYALRLRIHMTNWIDMTNWTHRLWELSLPSMRCLVVISRLLRLLLNDVFPLLQLLVWILMFSELC